MFFLFIIFYLTTAPWNAYAYLDPGTGSYIFQMILASFIGVSFAIKIFWARIKGFFVNIFSAKKIDEDDDH